MDLPGLHFRHERETATALKKIWDPMDHKNGVKLAEILGAHHQGKHGAPTPTTSFSQMGKNAAGL